MVPGFKLGFCSLIRGDLQQRKSIKGGVVGISINGASSMDIGDDDSRENHEKRSWIRIGINNTRYHEKRYWHQRQHSKAKPTGYGSTL